MTEQGTLFDDLPVYLGRISRHPLYNVWRKMRDRCFNPDAVNFRAYGGRGIVVCDEWRNSSRAFVAWAIKSGWKPGLEIDRENNDGPYSPANCRFVTRLQNQNNKKNTIRLSDGTPLADAIRSVPDIASKFVFYRRIEAGLSPDEAVSRPIRPRTRVFLADGTPLAVAIRRAGLPPPVVRGRIRRGWSPDDAVSIPKGGKRPLPDGFQSVGDAAARVVAATAAVALGESEASAQGDKAQRPAVRRKPLAKRKGRAPAIPSICSERKRR